MNLQSSYFDATLQREAMAYEIFRHAGVKAPRTTFAEVYINDEHTEFNLTEDYKTFWIPGDWDIYEHFLF